MTEEPTIEQRLIKLATQALNRTREGLMRWSETDDSEVYQFSGTRTSLLIERFKYDNHFEFRVLNERGTMVERLQRYKGPDDENPWDDVSESYVLLADLHDAARRSALRIDEVITAAFTDLESSDEPPF